MYNLPAIPAVVHPVEEVYLAADPEYRAWLQRTERREPMDERLFDLAFNLANKVVSRDKRI